MEQKLIILEENEHLKSVQNIIKSQLEAVNKSLNKGKKDIIEQKKYLWENIYELDPEEILSNRLSISENHDSYEFREKQKRLLLKLMDNSYFGKIDFIFDGDDEINQLYIGLGGLQDTKTNEQIIYDWRAPISSMYYDFDNGKAHYEAPTQTIYGEIINKRQIKIESGKLKYAFDSNVKIDDEILQKELSRNGSVKMKNIVATIQKEQNSIVRDQNAKIMVVQGVAGSGKTSIALHRIAFILYQNRKKIRSRDVLIISPNNIFSDYISNVLPELGEENITEMSFDEMAQHELKKICKFESKYEQMEYIIGCSNENDVRLRDIRFKNSFMFINEVKLFAKDLEKSIINFTKYKFKEYEISKETIERWYFEDFKLNPIFVRLDKIGDRIADCYDNDNNKVVSISERNEIKNNLKEMAETSNIIILYKKFLNSIKNKYSELSKNSIEELYLLYEDVFPVILLKLLLFGKRDIQYNSIKHVIIDEMQDYTIAQYEILNLLFNCKMTILGDINQVVDRSDNSVLNILKNIFGKDIKLIKMLKSYRSTYEISEFCRKLCNLNEAQSFERHGKEPVIFCCNDYKEMIEKIQIRIDELNISEYRSSAIICKTAKQAEKLYNMLGNEYKEICYLMNKENSEFKEGIVITNSYLVKGLEFDCVIVPQVIKEDYKTEKDRQILYIACTRALHELNIYYYGKKSDFIV